MTASEILKELEALGSASYRRTLANHGVPDPCFGVKISDLKKIQKRVKKDYELALALYDSGVYDAMYLAGLIADDERMTKKDLRKWAKKACRPLAGYTVPSVAAGSPHAVELAREWIASDTELITVAGWATFSCLVSVRPDDELDLAELRKLLRHVRKSIHQAPNYVRYEMNGFVISVGSYVTSLTELTKEVGDAIGRVSVDMGNTACQVPFAPDYIRKVEQHGSLGKKRKSAKC